MILLSQSRGYKEASVPLLFNFIIMNHTEVTQKWYWERVRETIKLGFQCVAWPKLYCSLRGYPIKAFGWSAIKWWDTGSPFDKTWERILPTAFNSPQEGDIIFWSEARCKDWHVAVANKFCNPSLLRYSDQNGTGNEDRIQPRWSTYRHVLGWFHRIPQ